MAKPSSVALLGFLLVSSYALANELHPFVDHWAEEPVQEVEEVPELELPLVEVKFMHGPASIKVTNWPEPDAINIPNLAIDANDMFGFNALSLVGYAAQSMKVDYPDQSNRETVNDIARNMGKIGSIVHPHKDCQKHFAKLYGEDAVAEKMVDMQYEMKGMWGPSNADRGLLQASLNAAAAWACLPGKYSRHDFIGAIEFDTWISARNFKGSGPKGWNAAFKPQLRSSDDDYYTQFPDNGKSKFLSACKASGWTHTCSFWSIAHATALNYESQATTGRHITQQITDMVTTITQVLTPQSIKVLNTSAVHGGIGLLSVMFTLIGGGVTLCKG